MDRRDLRLVSGNEKNRAERNWKPNVNRQVSLFVEPSSHQGGGEMNPIREALQKLNSAKEKLKSLGVVRSERLTSELGEYFVSQLFNYTRAESTSNKGWDMKSLDGKKVQVKAHAKGWDNHYGYTHIPDFDLFDELVIVVMTPDYRIKYVFQMSSQEAQKKSKMNVKARRFELPWKSLEKHRVTPSNQPSHVWEEFGTV